MVWMLLFETIIVRDVVGWLLPAVAVVFLLFAFLFIFSFTFHRMRSLRSNEICRCLIVLIDCQHFFFGSVGCLLTRLNYKKNFKNVQTKQQNCCIRWLYVYINYKVWTINDKCICNMSVRWAGAVSYAGL